MEKRRSVDHLESSFPLVWSSYDQESVRREEILDQAMQNPISKAQTPGAAGAERALGSAFPSELRTPRGTGKRGRELLGRSIIILVCYK
jgi:hypothetical protein